MTEKKTTTKKNKTRVIPKNPTNEVKKRVKKKSSAKKDSEIVEIQKHIDKAFEKKKTFKASVFQKGKHKEVVFTNKIIVEKVICDFVELRTDIGVAYVPKEDLKKHLKTYREEIVTLVNFFKWVRRKPSSLDGNVPYIVMKIRQHENLDDYKKCLSKDVFDKVEKCLTQ